MCVKYLSKILKIAGCREGTDKRTNAQMHKQTNRLTNILSKTNVFESNEITHRATPFENFKFAQNWFEADDHSKNRLHLWNLTPVLLSFCVRRMAVPKHSFGDCEQTVTPIDFKFCGMIDSGRGHPSHAPNTSCSRITLISTCIKTCDNFCFSQLMEKSLF